MEGAILTTLFLLAVTGGYNYTQRTEAVRLEIAHHAGGWRVYFPAVQYAALLFLVAAFLCVLLSALSAIVLFSLEQVHPVLHSRISDDVKLLTTMLAGHKPYALHVLLVLTFLISWPASWVQERRTPPEDRRHIAEKSMDELIGFLHRAAASGVTLCFTLKSQKVYIGRALLIPEPEAPAKYISILPYISGYRSGDDHTLQLTTYYGRMLRRKMEQGSPESLAVYLPVTEIESAREYDLNIDREMFQDPRSQSESRPPRGHGTRDENHAPSGVWG